MQPSPGLTYSYLFDAMGRPSGMTEGSPVYNWVKDVVYNAAGMRWSTSKGAVFYNLDADSERRKSPFRD